MGFLVLTTNTALSLRRLTVFTFPPALLLCVIHGISSGIAVPSLGLIPAFFSSLLGTFLMYRDVIAVSGSPVSLTRMQVCLADLALGLSILFFLVLSWIFVPSDRYETRKTMLGTYATVPLMVNSFLHFYFFLGNGVCLLEFHQGCPNCRPTGTAVNYAPEAQPALGRAGDYRDDEAHDVEAQAP